MLIGYLRQSIDLQCRQRFECYAPYLGEERRHPRINLIFFRQSRRPNFGVGPPRLHALQADDFARPHHGRLKRYLVFLVSIWATLVRLVVRRNSLPIGGSNLRSGRRCARASG